MNAPAGPLPEQPLHFHRPPGKIHAKTTRVRQFEAKNGHF